MGRRSTDQGQPLSIRLKQELVDSLTEASEKLEISLHDTIRQTIKLGLADLRAIDFDVTGAIRKAKDQQGHFSEIALLAEPPSEYQTKRKKATS